MSEKTVYLGLPVIPLWFSQLRRRMGVAYIRTVMYLFINKKLSYHWEIARQLYASLSRL